MNRFDSQGGFLFAVFRGAGARVEVWRGVSAPSYVEVWDISTKIIRDFQTWGFLFRGAKSSPDHCSLCFRKKHENWRNNSAANFVHNTAQQSGSFLSREWSEKAAETVITTQNNRNLDSDCICIVRGHVCLKIWSVSCPGIFTLQITHMVSSHRFKITDILHNYHKLPEVLWWN